MNVALRLLMRQRSAVAPSATPLRTAWAIGSTNALNFSEGTALDSSHLLIAVWAGPADNNPTMTGWTQLADGGASAATATYTRIWVRAGNSSVNGVTWTGGPTGIMTVYAFPGFSTVTPLETETTGGSATSRSITPSATPAGTGLAIMAYSIFAVSAASFSNGYVKPAGNQPGTTGTNGTGGAAFKSYDAGVGTYNTTMTWDGTSRRNRLQLAILPVL